MLSNTSPEHLWATEGFLLASVLTIATQSRPDHQLLHTRLRRHIDQLILRVALAARSVRNVGSVEGLLLLAEWMPHLMGSDGQFQESQSQQSSTYDEDCVAWNLIGLAVRQAYLLQLDKQSFPVEVESEPHGITCRKRLAWICRCGNVTGGATDCIQLHISPTVRYRFKWARHFGVAALAYRPDSVPRTIHHCSRQ